MSPPLAQIMIQNHAPPPALGWIVVALVVASSLMVMIPAMAVLRALQRRREWDHAERLRTLDLGLTPVPRDPSAWPKAFVCTAIGAGLPVIALIITALVYVAEGPEELWVVPSLISPVCVIAASILAGYLFRTSASTTPAQADAPLAAKPLAFDPDAYDVAGRRG